jgi:hypothetical protein
VTVAELDQVVRALADVLAELAAPVVR